MTWWTVVKDRLKRRLLTVTIDFLDNPSFLKDENFVYLECNKAFCKMIGADKEKIIGHTVFDIAPADLAGVYNQADKDLWDKDGDQMYDSHVQFSDGERVFGSFYKSVMHDRAGNKIGIMGIFTPKTPEIIEQEMNECAGDLTILESPTN